MLQTYTKTPGQTIYPEAGHAFESREAVEFLSQSPTRLLLDIMLRQDEVSKYGLASSSGERPNEVPFLSMDYNTRLLFMLFGLPEVALSSNEGKNRLEMSLPSTAIVENLYKLLNEIPYPFDFNVIFALLRSNIKPRFLNPNLFTSLTNWQNRTNVEQRIDSSLTEQLSRRAQPLLYIPKGDGMYDETCQRKTMFQLLSVLERELLKRANLPDMFEITDVRRVLREGIQSGRITDELVFKMRNDKVKGYKDSLYERARKAIWFTYSLQNKHCKDFGTDPYLLGPEIDPLTGRVRVVYAPPTLDNFRAFRDATELWSAGNYFLGMDDAS